MQNIFIGFNKITEIWYNGQPISKVVYQGQIIWERQELPDGIYMQDLTPEQCADAVNRSRVTMIDRRNNQSYYVQKIGNLCYMETNLRYAGDGNYDPSWGYDDDRYATTTTNDTANSNDNIRPLTMTSSWYFGGSIANGYTTAGIADAGGSSTLDTTTPTNNTTFYGYMYNWCSAMGGQANACNSTSTTGFDTAESICPTGWRLPTGGTGGEFQTLNTAVNGGATNTDAGLRNNFLAVYSGNYNDAFGYQGSGGYYWSSTIFNATYAYAFGLTASSVGPMNIGKYIGFAVRCVF